MDKTDALIIAQQYANAVNANYGNIRIILFGSYAKGNYNEDSDIDIAVVFKDYSNLMDMQLQLMRLRRKIDSRIEPHPFRESEFELSNPIVNEIVKYGQEININAPRMA
ncbi:MAG: nucleotidyltransferase domain-containing protein [Bacteroidales bacterium]|nr:nucleotidyltransferase domain-containing protein [Bacteroidales bacterium]